MNVNYKGCSLLLVCYIKKLKGLPLNYIANILFSRQSNTKFFLVFIKTHSPGILFTIVKLFI